MSRRRLTCRFAALAVAAALALPGTALARPARGNAAAPWSPLWAWLARLAAVTAGPAAPARPRPDPGRLHNAWAKQGSTVDPDGRRTALVVDPRPAPAPLPYPSGDGTAQ